MCYLFHLLCADWLVRVCFQVSYVWCVVWRGSGASGFAALQLVGCIGRRVMQAVVVQHGDHFLFDQLLGQLEVRERLYGSGTEDGLVYLQRRVVTNKHHHAETTERACVQIHRPPGGKVKKLTQKPSNKSNFHIILKCQVKGIITSHLHPMNICSVSLALLISSSSFFFFFHFLAYWNLLAYFLLSKAPGFKRDWQVHWNTLVLVYIDKTSMVLTLSTWWNLKKATVFVTSVGLGRFLWTAVWRSFSSFSLSASRWAWHTHKMVNVCLHSRNSDYFPKKNSTVLRCCVCTYVSEFMCIPACVPLCRLSPLWTQCLSLFLRVLSLHFLEEQSQSRSWEQEVTSGPASAAAGFPFAVCGGER